MITFQYIPLVFIAKGSGCKKETETTRRIPTISDAPPPAHVPVIGHKDFRDEELHIPSDYLKTQGNPVTVASTDTARIPEAAEHTVIFFLSPLRPSLSPRVMFLFQGSAE